jgi:hypothetical protein
MSNNELEDEKQLKNTRNISLFMYAGIRNIEPNTPPFIIDRTEDNFKEEYLKLLFEQSKNNNRILRIVGSLFCTISVVLFFIPLPLAVPIGLAMICYDEHNWWPFVIYMIWVIIALWGMWLDDKIKWMDYN